MNTRLAPLLLIATACLPLRGAAQSVSGAVVEQGTGVPVLGAMVVLVDSSGTPVDRALTDAAGGFVVNVDAPGLHHIEVERIGYADWAADPFRATASNTFITIEVPLVPMSLQGIDVSGEQRCRAGPETGPATARVWAEARKALVAEVHTREAENYRYRLRRFERELDRSGRIVLGESIAESGYKRAAFVSFPIGQLATRGFVQVADDTMRVHYAPDAEALLSEVFLDSHCFGVREGEGGRIGLTFEPLPGASRSDIEGVLWLDAETSELDRLEFLYRYVLQDREVGEPGGEVAFTRLPNGAWIVRDWKIRMPEIMQVHRGRLRRTGYREEGGTTWVVEDATGRTLVHARFATVFGAVSDSVGTGAPPTPVVVEVPGTGVRAFTEADGSFLLVGLEAGRHELAVPHPLLAEWGLAAPAQAAVEGGLGEAAHARLRVPTAADVLAASCGGVPRPAGTAAFLGRVASADGAPLDAMRVEARWPRASGYAAPAIAAPAGAEGARDRSWIIGGDGAFVTAATTTGRRGLFLLCDVAHGTRLRVDVMGPPNSEPLLSETFLVDAGTGAVVETLSIEVPRDR